MADFDLVVQGGSVLDGTGSEARDADIAVRDGLIVEVGDVSGSATRTIDASGALVIPGIVDIHAHYDGQATWDSRLQPSSWHGVTTAVMGNCGVGFAPVHDDAHDKLIELMEGVEDIPGAALHEGLSWKWNSFSEFLDAVEARPHDIDIAAQVPHGALRLHVMGERGANHEDATPADIAAMAELVRQGIEAGALGFSTSRTRNHKTSTGAYTPTLTAAPAELIGIAEGVGAAGTGVLQVVSDFFDVDAEFATLRSMVERSGRPMSISVARNPQLPDAFRGWLDHITAANAKGLKMTGQVAARAVGLILGLECTLNPFLTNPVYSEIAELPHANKVALLREPEFRDRLLAAAGERSRAKLGGNLIARFDLLFEMTDEPDYEPSLDDSIAAHAARAGVTPEEYALDAMVNNGGRHDGKGLLYLPFLNYVDGNLDGVHEMLQHPHTVPGLGDGGAHVGTICDGSFPTTLLAYWGRDRKRGTVPLPYLVQQHCRDTARTVGLFDRGVLAPGYRADINVVDYDGLRLHKPEIVPDLPAGGKRLLQRADGWTHTIVAGVETYNNGEATSALPGRLVRGAQPAPT
ncbi:amidohydrolase family protein [Ilumatobacter sp.]|uniref:N-acyl-D-amino-acid deacylase family protein n=1 Tax=Ilumatobacter sp. TaxID=1967498 RepID=UPI002A2F148D|nr:amidohydrolase family protein [Ilumatobacter sp.]